MAKNTNTLGQITKVLLIIGALNWGLFLFGWDVANWISGTAWATIVAIVYALVGLSGLWELIALFK